MQATAESSRSGSSSSSASSPPQITQDSTRSNSKATLHNFEIEYPQVTPQQHGWSARVSRISQPSRLPPPIRLAFLWLRGPRPKVDLPDPKPLLDIDVRLRGHHIVLPIESSFLRATRILSSHWLLFAVLAAGYIVSFAFFARAQFFQTPSDAFIGCTSTFWLMNNGCGLDGASCAPFNDSSFDFRCPAQCSGTILANPRTVGNERTAFVPLIVGGGDANRTYRGDSFICAAAIQSGLVSNSRGGCGTLDLIGNFTNFLPTSAHGLDSIGFPTVFPLSFRFREQTSLHHCRDLRDDALAFNAVITALLFLLLRPKPIVLFWSLVCIGYWHIILFSQPRGPPPPLDTAFATFLPALFICYAFWRLAFRFCLPAFRKAPIEATFLYLAPFWVGILAGQTTDRLPLQRLTSSDITKRSGAVTTLVVIVLIIAAIALNQLRVFRKTGWLPYYVGWYLLGGLVTLVLSQLPGLNLRIHHYILAMILMPGTALPTRVSALCQGYLLGLFLNGAAAYGFASILQTKADLRQDAIFGSDLASFVTNSTNFNASIPLANQSISWNAPPAGWDGFALLVDDVERYVGSALNFSLAAFNTTLPHFFRLALTSNGNTGDFTRAATLFPNGTWVDPLHGAT
ncbi:LCCL domain-containing protein [Mycena indigotica]|uniref:LCCL domain-containing protein n=1 Tax=Mycena indigotica TaxID=2126181 RepID=A0A8H6SYT3_9AGAR|nr:LCCL domain-containing protein [Mycena indigotica]KAF7306792.1 LCCL domain-containing protein [Mycena indigotica]